MRKERIENMIRMNKPDEEGNLFQVGDIVRAVDILNGDDRLEQDELYIITNIRKESWKEYYIDVRRVGTYEDIIYYNYSTRFTPVMPEDVEDMWELEAIYKGFTNPAHKESIRILLNDYNKFIEEVVVGKSKQDEITTLIHSLLSVNISEDEIIEALEALLSNVSIQPHGGLVLKSLKTDAKYTVIECAGTEGTTYNIIDDTFTVQFAEDKTKDEFIKTIRDYHLVLAEAS